MTPPKVVAVIPARGGSKGIVRKNLEPLAGVPLVVWAVRAARGAESVTRTVVTTDDEEIANLAREAGAEIVMRPAELADDGAPMMPVLNHALDVLAERGFSPQVTALVEPTSPFRQPRHIDACIGKLSDGEIQSAVTVTRLERNPHNIFTVDGDRAKRYVQAPIHQFTDRQQFSHLKRVNGCVYATRTDNVRRGRLIVDPIRVVEMAQEESVNIDTPLDLCLAELYAERFGGRFPT